MATIRLTQLDGKLPNLALMKLAYWHKQQGDTVSLQRTPTPTIWEPEYDTVYGSAIFSWSKPVIDRLQAAYPDAIVGGTGSGSASTVEDVMGQAGEQYDYSLYPDFPHSIGFTQRGCRLKCGFCVVPKKEGAVKAVNTIADIHRPNTPKNIILLDNDFFGQDEWPERIRELREGGYKVSFNQGINVRMITPETARAVASVRYYDDQFKKRRIYTAWDNLGDESRFFDGLRELTGAGIPTRHVMVYMLIGFRKRETMEEIMYRYERLRDAGCLPFPMVYEKWRQPELRRFARWVIGRYDQVVSWAEFQRGQDSTRPLKDQLQLEVQGER